MARGGAVTFGQLNPGEKMMRQDGTIVMKMPDGSPGTFQTAQEADRIYSDALTEQRVAQQGETAGQFMRDKMAGLPQSLANIVAVPTQLAARGARNVFEGVTQAPRDLGAAIVPLIEGIGQEGPGGQSVFMRPEFQIPAQKFLQDLGRVGRGTFEMASVVPAGRGQFIEEAIEGTAPVFGAPERTAQELGGAANALSQFVPVGGIDVPRVVAKTLRRLPALGAALRGRTDPVAKAVVRTVNDVLIQGPRKIPFKRASTEPLEKAIGKGIAETVEEASTRAGGQLDAIAKAIPDHEIRDAPHTREALLEFLDKMGFTARAGDAGPLTARARGPQDAPGVSLLQRRRRTTGVATTLGERQAARMKNLLGGLTDPEASVLMERTGLTTGLLRDIAQNRVSFKTLDRVRKDVGSIVAKSKDPVVHTWGHNIIRAVKDDVVEQFGQFGDDIVQGYVEGLDTFANKVYPLRGLLNKNGTDHLVRTVKGMKAQELSDLRRALGPDNAADLITMTLTEHIDDAYNSQGIFQPGKFRDAINGLEFREKMSALLDPQTTQKMNTVVMALEEAERVISSTARLGAFARPYAIFQVVRGHLAGTGAFVIPEAIKRTGRAEAASIISAARGRTVPSDVFEVARSLFMGFETARQKYDEAAERYGFDTDEDPSATMRQGMEGLLQRFRQQRQFPVEQPRQGAGQSPAPSRGGGTTP